MRRRPSLVAGASGWAVILLAAGLAGCSSSSTAAPHAGVAPASATSEEKPLAAITVASTNLPLSGARCQGERCRCRAAGDDSEEAPPAEGHKRIEIRLAADGGAIELTSSILGRFATKGAQEACWYFDLVAGSSSDYQVKARADSIETGMAPQVSIAEYGPKGPFWYDILHIDCVGRYGRCDRAGADRWGTFWQQRRRKGRLDPCGSIAVTKLAWDTSGGLAERDGGFFRDIAIGFSLDVKKYATQFAPHAKECGGT